MADSGRGRILLPEYFDSIASTKLDTRWRISNEKSDKTIYHDIAVEYNFGGDAFVDLNFIFNDHGNK